MLGARYFCRNGRQSRTTSARLDQILQLRQFSAEETYRGEMRLHFGAEEKGIKADLIIAHVRDRATAQRIGLGKRYTRYSNTAAKALREPLSRKGFLQVKKHCIAFYYRNR